MTTWCTSSCIPRAAAAATLAVRHTTIPAAAACGCLLLLSEVSKAVPALQAMAMQKDSEAQRPKPPKQNGEAAERGSAGIAIEKIKVCSKSSRTFAQLCPNLRKPTKIFFKPTQNTRQDTRRPLERSCAPPPKHGTT